MKRGVLALIVLLSLSVVFSQTAINTDCTTAFDSLASGSYYLDIDLSSNYCLEIYNDDTHLDCRGHSITFHQSDVSGDYGINVVSTDNVTIENCVFIEQGSGNNGASALRLQGDNTNLRFINNTVSSRTLNPDLNFVNGAYENLSFINNTIYQIQGSPSGNRRVLYSFRNISNLLIANNNFTANVGSSGNCQLIVFGADATNFTIENNYFSCTSTTNVGQAIVFSGNTDVNHSTIRIRNNTIVNNGGSGVSSHAIQFLYSRNILVERNTIDVTSASTDYGIRFGLVYPAENISILNNTITTGEYGIQLQYVHGALVSGNTYNTPAHILFTNSSNIRLAGLISQYNFTNLDFNYSNNGGTISFENNITGSGSNLSAVLSINNTHVFVNSSLAPEFNQSARVTLSNTGLVGHQLYVDYADNGNFVVCPPSLCVEISDTPSQLIFDVTHFTTFTIAELADAIPEFHEWALMILMVVALAGITVMRKNNT